MRRAQRRVTIAMAIVTVMALVAGPALAATRIVFPRGSFCGSYSGNYRNGKEFVLGLKADQRFTVTNTGVGRQTTWSVSGPTGDLEGYRQDRSTFEYYTEATGSHYVFVTSTARRSAVQFCAY